MGIYAQESSKEPHDRPFWRSWYNSATRLLGSSSTDELEAQKKEKAIRILSEIEVLSKELLLQEARLAELTAQRDSLKEGWTWFLDSEIRNNVDQAQLRVMCFPSLLDLQRIGWSNHSSSVVIQVNDQRRIVENVFEDISVHWKQLKPLYGVFSKMFFTEVLIFLLNPILTFLDFFMSFLSLGFLFFLIIMGPAAVFLVTFAFLFGVSLLPFFGAVLIVLYSLEFPFLVLEVYTSLSLVLTFCNLQRGL